MLVRRTRALATSVLILPAVAAGLAVTAAPAQADPTPNTVRVLVSEGAFGSVSFGDLHWHDGNLYTIRDGDGPTSIGMYAGDGSSPTAPLTDTDLPNGWGWDTYWQNDMPAFEVAADGSYYVRAPYSNSNSGSSHGFGVGHLALDGTMSPATIPPGAVDYPTDNHTLGGSSESLVLDPDGSGVILGGTRYRANGVNYGVVAEVPLPTPDDQQLGAEIIAAADNYDPDGTGDIAYGPFLADQHIHAATQPSLSSYIGDVDAKGPYVYLRDNVYDIHRVDRRTGEIVTVCCGEYQGWDTPPPAEGDPAMDTFFTIQAGPVADRDGNLFFANGDTSRFDVRESIIWEIRASDGTLHQVAGGGVDNPSDGADAVSVTLAGVGDLDLDDDGNLYVTNSPSFYSDKQILEFPGVAAADTAPGAPRNLLVTSGSGGVEVAWTAPADDGGQPVESYTVRVHPSGVSGTAQDLVQTVAGLDASVDGLANGTTYDVSVVATNPRGDGPAATATAAPTPYAASLTATPDRADAGDPVVLDATATRAPAGATYTFYCDARVTTTTPPTGAGRTALCTYPRGSTDEGYQARVVVTDGEETWDATTPVVVDDPVGTVEGSGAFDVASPDLEVTANPDGSLTSDTCGADSTGATCLDALGARIVLTAAAGTLRPGTLVRIYQGDDQALQGELGPNVQVQGGFAVTWADAQGRKYELTKPLVVTITPTAAALRRTTRSQQLWDVGATFGAWGQAFVDGTSALANTIGSAFSFVGSALSHIWASAPQSVARPNDSRTNDVLLCSARLVATGPDSYRCDGVLTKLVGVPTDRIAALDAGGRVVAAGGANVVAAGGANVVAAGGANVVAAGGANFRLDAASVIAAGGGNVIAPGGGNVIAPGGGNVVAPGGGNVIAAGGGNVVAPGGGNRHAGRSTSEPISIVLVLTRDPGFVFAAPVDPTPPTAEVTLDPPAPTSGIYPYGTEVQVHVGASSAPGKQVDRVHFEVTGAQTTAYTIAAGHEADVTVSASGTSTVGYGAVDDNLAESEPGTVEVRIAEPRVPVAPTDISGVAGVLHTSVLFSWTAPADQGDLPLTGYTLRVTDLGLAGDDSGAEAERVLEASGTSLNVTGLLPGHRYTATVAGVSDAGEGASSTASAAVTTATAPQAPLGLAPTPGDGRVDLTWSAPLSSGGLPVTGYVVSRGPSVTGPFTQVGTPPTASFTDTTVANGSTYYYVVQAVNLMGPSDNSSVVSATPLATPPGPDPDPEPDPEPMPQTLSFAQPGDLTYGSADQPLTATATSGLAVLFTSLSTDVCTIVGHAVHVEGAGTCSIEAAQAGDEDWAAAPSVVHDLEVEAAPLQVAATDALMVRHGVVSAVSPEYVGLVAGDTPFDLTMPATCGVRVAHRTTTCGGVESLNYATSYAPGVLSVRRYGTVFTSPSLVHALAGERVTLLRVQTDGPGRPKLRWEGELPAGVMAHTNPAHTRLWFSGTPAEGVATVVLTAHRDGARVARQAVTFHTW